MTETIQLTQKEIDAITDYTKRFDECRDGKPHDWESKVDDCCCVMHRRIGAPVLQVCRKCQTTRYRNC